MKKKDLSLWAKLLSSLDSTLKRSGKWLTKHLSFAIEHLPDREELICRVFKNCVILLYMLKKSKTFQRRTSCILVSPQESKWTTFLDKLLTCEDPNTLTTLLFKILVQELISKEKAYQPFWTPAYKELSEKLSLPIKTDCAASDMNLSNTWSTSQEVRLPCCTIRQARQVNKNSQTTCWPSFMSSHVGKWESETISKEGILKSLQIRIKPTKHQREKIDEFIDTSRYVYNKTLDCIKNGHAVNWRTLRDLLVTNTTSMHDKSYQDVKSQLSNLHEQKRNTEIENLKEDLDRRIICLRKKLRELSRTIPSMKNPSVLAFELSTPKDVRTCAVKQVCDAYKSGFTNLKKGNIKYFSLKNKEKKDPQQWMKMTPKNIQIMDDGRIKMLPTFLGKDCYLHVSQRNKKKLEGLKITHDVTLCRRYGTYTLQIPIAVENKEPSRTYKATSIDLGLRTAATCFTFSETETIITEYEHPREALRALNKKIDLLKRLRKRKRSILKLEYKKSNIVDQFLWMFINHILKNNHVVFLGDIKSQDIVKKGNNKVVNREFNDMKFFVLKQRFLYKANLLHKIILSVPEPYTTKTCSGCGCMNEVGANKTFTCTDCKMKTDRDVNASKNIFMKAIMTM